MAGERPSHYPVSLVVAGHRCLVVGGGTVAARKVTALVRAGARVTVVAPEVVPAIEDLAVEDLARGTTGAGTTTVGTVGESTSVDITDDGWPVTVARRPYQPGEAARYRLVITATGVPAVDGAVAADADGAGVWVNSADDADHCTFLLPSVHRDGRVSIAVSTGGASPALATWLRERVAEACGPGLGALAELLEGARRRLQAQGRQTSSVDWHALLDGPLPRLVAEGRLDDARRLVEQAADDRQAR